jgi:mannitol/fructose-specific phosphotransferase system IIA component (Ntr-type)
MASLIDLLKEKMIRLKVSANNWEEALRQGGQLLIDDDGVEPRYLDAIINTVKELGPYVVIAPGLALGHAGPDMGVLKTCFSLITLKKPVEFDVPENDPVDIIFCFAAPNKEEHMEALRDMAMFCSETRNIDATRSSTEVWQIRELLIEFFQS